MVHEYFKWARYLYHHELIRDASIGHLEFPFPYRAGQRDLVVSVYRTASREKNACLSRLPRESERRSPLYSRRSVPSGKERETSSFLPHRKDRDEDRGGGGVRILRDHGLIFTSVTITAKEKSLSHGRVRVQPGRVPIRERPLDRVNEAVFDILHLEQEMTREKILQYAEKYRVCPFEYCLDISSWTDGIICDYNYVFDPNVYLKRFFQEGIKGDYIFLIDEAHNMVERSRQMYSAQIYKEDFLTVKRIMKEHSRSIEKRLKSAIRYCLG